MLQQLTYPQESLVGPLQGLPPSARAGEPLPDVGPATAPARCGGMVARSPSMVDLFGRVRRLADEDCPVLVTGETGTGKELVSRALHRLRRAGGPFVALNCAAIGETTALTELFGHERGAFTGAVSRHLGAFERANGGTLFLDEIGELPMSVQAKLLRVLETGELQRLGGERTLHVGFRLVAATHRDLWAEVRGGRFRRDLYYRIRVVELTIPPLRERLEDLPALVGEIFRRKGWGEPRLTREAWRALAGRTWPGNVRELVNTLERARIEAIGRAITQEMVSEPMGWAGDSPSGDWRRLPDWAIPVRGRTLKEIERDVILYHLEDCGWRQAEAARRLGLARQTLHDPLRRLGITIPGRTRGAG